MSLEFDYSRRRYDKRDRHDDKMTQPRDDEPDERVVINATTEARPTEELMAQARMVVQRQIQTLHRETYLLSKDQAALLATSVRLLDLIDKGFEHSDDAEAPGEGK